MFSPTPCHGSSKLPMFEWVKSPVSAMCFAQLRAYELSDESAAKELERKLLISPRNSDS